MSTKPARTWIRIFKCLLSANRWPMANSALGYRNCIQPKHFLSICSTHRKHVKHSQWWYCIWAIWAVVRCSVSITIVHCKRDVGGSILVCMRVRVGDGERQWLGGWCYRKMGLDVHTNSGTLWMHDLFAFCFELQCEREFLQHFFRNEQSVQFFQLKR